MLLGDFETVFWARSAVSALASRRHPSWPEIAEFGTAKKILSNIFCIPLKIVLPKSLTPL
ncbi:hypothetical protein LTZ13_12940 [Lacticaseibacillus paracasei]|nr:hypothetical protein [Lacticaseibacillus paracasei]MDE3286338.1 hypothetical protein [Lacticaseibacillus paracasei]